MFIKTFQTCSSWHWFRHISGANSVKMSILRFRNLDVLDQTLLSHWDLPQFEYYAAYKLLLEAVISQKQLTEADLGDFSDANRQAILHATKSHYLWDSLLKHGWYKKMRAVASCRTMSTCYHCWAAHKSCPTYHQTLGDRYRILVDQIQNSETRYWKLISLGTSAFLPWTHFQLIFRFREWLLNIHN